MLSARLGGFPAFLIELLCCHKRSTVGACADMRGNRGVKGTESPIVSDDAEGLDLFDERSAVPCLIGVQRDDGEAPVDFDQPGDGLYRIHVF